MTLAIITDPVGPIGSTSVQHEKIVEQAKARAPVYAQVLKELAQAVVNREVALPEPQLPLGAVPYSLEGSMYHTARNQESEIAQEILPKEQPLPHTQGELFVSLEADIKYREAVADNYDTWGYPDAAQMHRDVAEEYKAIHESMRKDGQKAYEFYITRRDRSLAGARARLAKMPLVDAIPAEYEANGTLTVELLEKRRREQMNEANWYEHAARTLSKLHPDISHTEMEINVD